MAVSGEQIRREQEESRRRSQFGAHAQVSGPLPPPWTSFWRRRERIRRWSLVMVLAFWPSVFATSRLVELIRPHGSATFVMVAIGYCLVVAFVGSRMALICPSCGYRFQIGRHARRSCQHCGLPYGQSG
jgi:hypothetical protein